MGRNVEVDRIQAIAVSMFAAALIERCQATIVRLTSPSTYAAEIADFREEAIRHVKSAAPIGLAAGDEADAMRTACEQIEEVCAEWLRGGAATAR